MGVGNMKNKSDSKPSWEEIGKAIGAKIEQEGKDGGQRQWCIKQPGPGSGGAFYGLGFLGALYYYLTTATGLWMGVIGVLKAILWPAFFVYEVLKFLGA